MTLGLLRPNIHSYSFLQQLRLLFTDIFGTSIFATLLSSSTALQAHPQSLYLSHLRYRDTLYPRTMLSLEIVLPAPSPHSLFMNSAKWPLSTLVFKGSLKGLFTGLDTCNYKEKSLNLGLVIFFFPRLLQWVTFISIWNITPIEIILEDVPK